MNIQHLRSQLWTNLKLDKNHIQSLNRKDRKVLYAFLKAKNDDAKIDLVRFNSMRDKLHQNEPEKRGRLQRAISYIFSGFQSSKKLLEEAIKQKAEFDGKKNQAKQRETWSRLAYQQRVEEPLSNSVESRRKILFDELGGKLKKDNSKIKAVIEAKTYGQLEKSYGELRTDLLSLESEALKNEYGIGLFVVESFLSNLKVLLKDLYEEKDRD